MQNHIHIVNPAFENLFGYAAAGIVGKPEGLILQSSLNHGGHQEQIDLRIKATGAYRDREVELGLSPHAEPLKTILSAAQAREIPVLGELAVFTRALDELKHTQDYQAKVLAVTGTNGKTTVTSLTRHLCQSVGVHAVAAGNISPSMLDALCDALIRQFAAGLGAGVIEPFNCSLRKALTPMRPLC